MNMTLQRLALACLLAAQCLAVTTLAGTAPVLSILAPKEGSTYVAPARVEVEAVGFGRFGGITDVELLLDDRPVAESHIVFIRPPTAEEPVHHLLVVADVGPGRHTLQVREIRNPDLTTETLVIEVLDSSTAHPAVVRVVSPLPSTTIPLGRDLEVQAVATGPLGGITRTELLVDGEVRAESHLVFIRPPEAGEPVHHAFRLEKPLPAGSYRLQVRDADRPATVSETVMVHVVAPLSPAQPPLLRLGTLADGTLLLVVSGPELAADIVIQSSSDLLRWQTVGADAFALPVPQPTPAVPVGGMRFYRAVRAGDVPSGE